MTGKRNPVTGKPMTFDQAMDASGAYAINAPWNETMANSTTGLSDPRIPRTSATRWLTPPR